MSSSKSFTALAGGHTTTIARELGINKKHFSYISLSGGALLSYISGKKLPGLEALEKGVK
jgi:phosphoglycerate kinase